MVTWTVRNDNLWPLMFYFINPCVVEFNICVRHNDGPCLEYDGILAHIREGWDYELLWPFQSYSCSFNVTDTFLMNKAGIYSIHYLGHQVTSETETQLITTMSFGGYHSSRSSFYSAQEYFFKAPTSPSNIIYMRKEKDNEIVSLSEEEEIRD